MDILGKKSEELEEEMNAVKNEIESLGSHIDAVDSALQDFVDNYNHMLQDEMGYQEEELMKLKEVVDRQISSEIAENQLSQNIKALEGRIGRLERRVDEETGDIVDTVKTVGGSIQKTREKIDEVEEKVEDLEDSFLIHKNNSEYDLEKKLNKRDYEKNREELEDEISRLKASVTALAEEIDGEEKIEVE